MAGATGAGLAKTGFNTFLLAIVAIGLLLGGLVLLRVAAVRRGAAASELS